MEMRPQPDPLIVRLGALLFRARGWSPVPLVIGLIFIASEPGWWASPGALALGAGLALRLWAVAHIGPGSRRRSAELGSLTVSGPYRRSRNPLYLGNLAMWVGVALLAGSPLAALVVLALLGAQYGAIIRWEEQLLRAEKAGAYADWAARTPRWWGLHAPEPEPRLASPDWRAAWRSERSTHLATAVVLGLVLAAGRSAS